MKGDFLKQNEVSQKSLSFLQKDWNEALFFLGFFDKKHFRIFFMFKMLFHLPNLNLLTNLRLLFDLFTKEIWLKLEDFPLLPHLSYS